MFRDVYQRCSNRVGLLSPDCREASAHTAGGRSGSDSDAGERGIDGHEGPGTDYLLHVIAAHG